MNPNPRPSPKDQLPPGLGSPPPEVPVTNAEISIPDPVIDPDDNLIHGSTDRRVPDYLTALRAATGVVEPPAMPNQESSYTARPPADEPIGPSVLPQSTAPEPQPVEAPPANPGSVGNVPRQPFMKSLDYDRNPASTRKFVRHSLVLPSPTPDGGEEPGVLRTTADVDRQGEPLGEQYHFFVAAKGIHTLSEQEGAPQLLKALGIGATRQIDPIPPRDDRFYWRPGDERSVVKYEVTYPSSAQAVERANEVIKSVAEAEGREPGIRLRVIEPGDYPAGEVLKSLEQGVWPISDNQGPGRAPFIYTNPYERFVPLQGPRLVNPELRSVVFDEYGTHDVLLHGPAAVIGDGTALMGRVQQIAAHYVSHGATLLGGRNWEDTKGEVAERLDALMNAPTFAGLIRGDEEAIGILKDALVLDPELRGLDTHKIALGHAAELRERLRTIARVLDSSANPLEPNDDQALAAHAEAEPSVPALHEGTRLDSPDGPPAALVPGESPSFEPYRPLMAGIDARFAEGVHPEEIEGYIGTEGRYYLYETPDGKVLQLPRTPLADEDTGHILDIRQEYIAPHVLAQGIRGLKQLVAYTEAHGGALVCEPVPGVTIEQLSQEELNTIPYLHFEEFMELSKEVARWGLDPDYSTASSIRYDERAGFTLTDYRIGPAPLSPEEAAKLSVARLFPNGIHDDQGRLHMETISFYDAYRGAFGQRAADELLGEWYRERP